jgi:hypothetical protein
MLYNDNARCESTLTTPYKGETDMNVKVNLAGQEIEVPVTPEQEAELIQQCAADTEKQYKIQFMTNFFRETSREIRREADFTTDETDLLVDELFHTYPNPQELCEAIIADNYLKQVQELADSIVEERAKIYRVTVRYEGEFEVLVKANDKDEAEDYVNNLSFYDLADYVDATEAEFDVDFTREDTTGATEEDVDLDATE